MRRFLLVYAMLPFFNLCQVKVDWRNAFLISFGGIRGAVALALAMEVAKLKSIYMPEDVVKLVTYDVGGLVLLTILVNGLLTSKVCRVNLRIAIWRKRARGMFGASVEDGPFSPSPKTNTRGFSRFPLRDRTPVCTTKISLWIFQQTQIPLVRSFLLRCRTLPQRLRECSCGAHPHATHAHLPTHVNTQKHTHSLPTLTSVYYPEAGDQCASRRPASEAPRTSNSGVH